MKILALDLGKFNTMCCFFDSKSKKHSFLNASTTREELTVVLKKRKIDLVVMEACGPSGWINDLAQTLGHKTIVCSTNEDAWRWTNVKRKTDKDDALKLARMASMNELHPVHMPSETHREFRSLVKYRKTLDQRINKMKCTIRAWFVNRGISIDRGEKAWCTGRAVIDSYRKPLAECSPNELWKGQLDIELTQLDTLTQHLQTVVRQLEAIGKNDARIQRIRTIPGVGPRTAEILVACIDDPHRFKNGRQVSAYFGLVPRQFQSGETDRNGRITKRGNPLARTILVECAWSSIRYNPWAQTIYERIYGKQKTRKKKAAVALARKIAVLAWAMLRDETDWDPLRMLAVGLSFGKTPEPVQHALKTMRPKENSDQRKKRLRKEAREAKESTTKKASTSRGKSNAKAKQAASKKSSSKIQAKNRKTGTRSMQKTPLAKSKPKPKPRRAREPVAAV